MMDKLKRFRRKPRVRRDVTQKFFTGKCHVCKQQNMTVGSLKCKKHNYCQLCAEFVPRFIKGDYTCKICIGESNTLAPVKANIYRVMDEVRQSSSKPPGVSPDSYTTSEKGDDSDTEGNNDDLDKLLFSLTQPQPLNHSDDLVPIPRKRSFLHLTLPAAHPASDERRPSNQPDNRANNGGQRIFNNYVNGFIECTRDYPSANEQIERHNSPPSLLRENPVTLQHAPEQKGAKPKLRGLFQPDPSEVERGSSPCKGLRPRSVDSSLSETEQLIQMLGHISGPDMTSSSSSRSGSANSWGKSLNSGYDEFWDA